MFRDVQALQRREVVFLRITDSDFFSGWVYLPGALSRRFGLFSKLAVTVHIELAISQVHAFL